MKCASAADMKSRYSESNKRDLPREGTKTRGVYDLFQSNKGVILNTTLKELGLSTKGATALIDFYGLDIRWLGHHKWCLVGEWFGKTYIDYLAEKVKPAKVKRK